MEGYKDIWIGEQERAKFWLSVCNNLKNRGVKGYNDIMYGL